MNAEIISLNNMKPPTPYLDNYAHTMLMFYLQERNIPFSAIDHIEVSLIKDKSTMTKHRKIKIILKQNKNGK